MTKTPWLPLLQTLDLSRSALMLSHGITTVEVRNHTGNSGAITKSFAIGVISTSSNCGNSINHCVMITGYSVVNGVPVWNVRNSYVARRKRHKLSLH